MTGHIHLKGCCLSTLTVVSLSLQTLVGFSALLDRDRGCVKDGEQAIPALASRTRFLFPLRIGVLDFSSC